MSKKIDKSGQRFGMLTVLRRLESGDYECLCDCGNTCIVKANHITRNKSCGCLKKLSLINGRTKHNGTRTRLHNIWLGMRERCNSPTGFAHRIYYDRGITICDEWNDFSVFRDWAMSNGYDSKAKHGECTIDRIDNNKGYSPENCRFVSQKVNSRNRRDVKRFMFEGEYLCCGEVSERTGVPTKTIRERIRRGWNIERAGKTPINGSI